MNAVLEWHARSTAMDAPTPQPVALVAQHRVARAVLLRLCTLEAADMARLSVSATMDFLLLTGPPELWPWADGVQYCAPAADAPGLWLPTHRVPTIASDLLYAALCKRVGSSPLLLWHEPEQIFPLNETVNLTPALLQWLIDAF